MNQILIIGNTVHTATTGHPCKVEQFLGGGGQGEVYRANLCGKSVALKWYFPQTATAEQRDALETIIKKGSPSDKFLWPMELTKEEGIRGFGYIMPLRESRFKGIVDMMKRRIEPNFRSLATAGFELAHSFLQLHSMGLCYRDISFGNVFFDPDTGEILICDNDNVNVDGETKSGILGTPRFMAPEVVINKARPSTKTDLFSLAVLLFYMLLIHHPLEGAREAAIHSMDLPAMTELYGKKPIFIFDPKNQSNRPVPGYHDNAIAFWPIYPKFLKDLFTQSFTQGIHDPENGRVRESVWRANMIRLRDSILYCGFCGSENFYDSDAIKKYNGKLAPCWSCKKEIKLPPRIRIEKNVIMLNHDTKIYPHHIDNGKSYDFSQPVAEVSKHPTNPNIWGLRNLSNQKWVYSSSDGNIKEIEPGQNLSLKAGAKINFGTSEGEIKV